LSTTTNQDGAVAAESPYPAPRQNRANIIMERAKQL
jgi:hypothetical protein